MRVLLVKLKHRVKELRDQLEDKDVEVERLKNKLINKNEEQEDTG